MSFAIRTGLSSASRGGRRRLFRRLAGDSDPRQRLVLLKEPPLPFGQPVRAANLDDVTTYSGPFVARSVLPVVITFAPVLGWWKVVYTTPGCIRAVTLARNAISPERLVTETRPPSRIAFRPSTLEAL